MQRFSATFRILFECIVGGVGLFISSVNYYFKSYDYTEYTTIPSSICLGKYAASCAINEK